jgi:hypothetical protein
MTLLDMKAMNMCLQAAGKGRSHHASQAVMHSHASKSAQLHQITSMHLHPTATCLGCLHAMLKGHEALLNAIAGVKSTPSDLTKERQGYEELQC